jgi:hypothetical protein
MTEHFKDILIRYLKRLRTAAVVFCGGMFLAIAIIGYGRPITMARQLETFLFVTFFGSIILPFVFQLVIIRLVGGPPADLLEEIKNIKAGGLPAQKHPRKNVIVDAIYGANAYKRTLVFASLLLLPIILLTFKENPNGFFKFWIPFSVAVWFWQVYFKYARLRFYQDRVELESSAYNTWGLGRHVSISYQEIELSQPKIMLGDALTIYRGGRFLWYLNGRGWNSLFQIVHEFAHRVPPGKFDFFYFYKN